MLNITSLCTSNGYLFLEDATLRNTDRSFYMGILFIGLGCLFLPICSFVFSVFCRAPLIHISCYKLLTITTALDILNLITSAFVCGFLALRHRTPCMGDIWILYFSNFSVAGWLMYSAGAEVLALNRLLVFFHPKLASKLFEGGRCWLWLAYIIGYPIVLTLANLDKTYVFVPSAGVVYDVEYNPMHFMSNLVKMSSVTVAYLLVLYKVCKMRKLTGNQDGNLMFQIKISIQTLVIAALADVCATTYTITSYFPEEWEIRRWSGLIGQLSWILLHGGTGIIYLCLNTPVKDALKALIGKNRTAPCDIYTSGMNSSSEAQFVQNLHRF